MVCAADSYVAAGNTCTACVTSIPLCATCSSDTVCLTCTGDKLVEVNGGSCVDTCGTGEHDDGEACKTNDIAGCAV